MFYFMKTKFRLAYEAIKKIQSVQGISAQAVEACFIGMSVFFVSFGISLLTPPFQSPDEFAHFQRAYFLSQGNTNLIVRNGVVGAQIDPAYLKYQGYYKGIPRQTEKSISASKVKMSKDLQWSNERIFMPHFSTTPYMFAVYLPQALAIKIGQSLNLSIDTTYKLARLTLLFAITLCLAKAFVITQPGLLTLSLLFMPMTLFQFGSATIDGLSIALSILIVSIFSRSTKSNESVSKIDFAIMVMAILTVSTSRLYMLPLVLLPIFVVMKSRDKSEMLILGLGISVVIWWLGFGWIHSSMTQEQFEQSRIETLTFYLRQPFQLLEIFSDTLIRLSGFYVDGFIGILGWLDTRFSRYFYQASTFFLFAAFILSFSLKQVRENAPFSATLILVSVASCALVFVAMLVSAHSHPVTVIPGVQGRYFMIPAIMFSYAISGSIRSENAMKSLASVSLLLLWVVFVCLFTIPLLRDRYSLSAGG